jgi:plastocyanin
MRFIRPSVRPSRRYLLVVTGWLAAILAVALIVFGRASAPSAAGMPHDHMMMNEQEMQAKLAAWLALHPDTPGSPLAVAADTFMVGDFYMDNNGDQVNGPDTAFIQPGDAVMWKWVAGSHTTTNGVNPADPTAGTIWTHSINSLNQTFTQVFPNEGVFPFFCMPHFSLMFGTVVVRQTVSVRPLGDPVARIGFLSPPAPNPTSGRVLFRFGLGEAGLARAEILDARGRLIAVPVNDRLQAGAFSGAWNGLTTGGVHVSPGVYFVKLTVPGRQESRSIVLTQ